jgi:hypothetical protein
MIVNTAHDRFTLFEKKNLAENARPKIMVESGGKEIHYFFDNREFSTSDYNLPQWSSFTFKWQRTIFESIQRIISLNAIYVFWFCGLGYSLLEPLDKTSTSSGINC